MKEFHSVGLIKIHRIEGILPKSVVKPCSTTILFPFVSSPIYQKKGSQTVHLFVPETFRTVQYDEVKLFSILFNDSFDCNCSVVQSINNDFCLILTCLSEICSYMRSNLSKSISEGYEVTQSDNSFLYSFIFLCSSALLDYVGDKRFILLRDFDGGGGDYFHIKRLSTRLTRLYWNGSSCFCRKWEFF